MDGGTGHDTLLTGSDNDNDRGTDFTGAALLSIEQLQLLPTDNAANFNQGDNYAWAAREGSCPLGQPMHSCHPG